MVDPIDILARTIYGEARGSGRAGMAAIAAVILNRAAHPRWWGSDIVSVCQHPWQFSCWNESDPNRAKILSATGTDVLFTIALSVADMAVTGRLPDPTHGADSYYAETMPEPPAWSIGLTPTAIIGGQRFYRTELPPQPTETA